jgi:hypothetical protein
VIYRNNAKNGKRDDGWEGQLSLFLVSQMDIIRDCIAHVNQLDDEMILGLV